MSSSLTTARAAGRGSAFAFALAFLPAVAGGCGGASSPPPDAAACAPDVAVPDGAAPEAAAGPDGPAPADTATPPDAAAPADADAAADADAGQDAASPPDAASPSDGAPPPDGLLAADARLDRLPPTDASPADGITLTSDAWADGVWAEMVIGVLDDLEVAMGVNLLASVHIADRIHVMGGYGIDYVVFKVGNIRPAAAGQLGPLVYDVGGQGRDEETQQPAHPQYLPAQTLFDSMKNVPTIVQNGKPTRTSPRGRVRCYTEPGAAFCTITGALWTRAN